MGIPSYKELKLVPVDSNVEIEEKQELVLHLIFDFFIGRKALNRLNNMAVEDVAKAHSNGNTPSNIIWINKILSVKTNRSSTRVDVFYIT